MYKHLHLRFLQNVEDTTRIFSNEAMQGHSMIQRWDRKKKMVKIKAERGTTVSSTYKTKGIIWITRLIHLYQTLRVGPIHSTNQTIAQKLATDWLKAHHQVIFNLKTASCDRKLFLQTTFQHVCYCTAFPELSWISLKSLRSVSRYVEYISFSLLWQQLLKNAVK